MHGAQYNTALVAATQQHVTCSMEQYFQATKFYTGLQSHPNVKASCPDPPHPSARPSSSFRTPEVTGTRASLTRKLADGSYHYLLPCHRLPFKPWPAWATGLHPASIWSIFQTQNRSYFEQSSNLCLGKSHPSYIKQCGIRLLRMAFSGEQQWHSVFQPISFYTISWKPLTNLNLFSFLQPECLHFVCSTSLRRCRIISLFLMFTQARDLQVCIYPQARQVPLSASQTFPCA